MSRIPTTSEPKLLVVESLAKLIIEAGQHDKIVLNTPEDRMHAMFVDPRVSGSMLLTKFGWDVLKAKFPYWAVELKNVMTFGDHTFLVATSTYPYYILAGSVPKNGAKKSKDTLVTFDGDLGVLMKMVSGDFTKMKRLRPTT